MDDVEMIYKDFQRDLIKYYNQYQSMIPVSPLIKENDTSLVDFYVPPPLKAVDVHNRFRRIPGHPEKPEVSNYQQLFFLDSSNSYKHIYVTANAGIGKTVFCQRICMTWCQAQEQFSEQNINEADIHAIGFYEFVFLITLRNVESSLCDLDEFIKSFVKNNLPQENRYWEYVDQILNARKCLIIMDGLDEWNHPSSCYRSQGKYDIPHAKCWNNCTVLTTTRTWKFDEIRVSSKFVDRQIEICEMDQNSSRRLVSNAVELFNRSSTPDQCRELVEQFYEQISLLNLEDILHIPYVNLQMVCLWLDRKKIGKSKTEIYSEMIELTLQRGIDNHNATQTSAMIKETSHTGIPQCLQVRSFCHRYGSLILNLGKAAFHTLFSSEKQMSLVFDKNEALKYLNNEEISFCLNCGLLSQNKGYVLLSQRQSYVSFQHKSVQEYFSAIYIQSQPEDEEVNKTMWKACSSLKSILEMSNVFVFLSGLNPHVCGHIFNPLILQTLSNDKDALSYRTNVEVMLFKERFYKTMHEFQNLLVSCMREGIEETTKTLSLNIEDIIIEENSKSEQYMSVLEHVLSSNASSVKSLSVIGYEIVQDFEHILIKLNLKSTRSLIKLVLYTNAREQDIADLLCQNKNTLQCVSIGTSYNKFKNTFGDKIQLSRDFQDALINIPLLQTLVLAYFEMEHEQLDAIAKLVSEWKSMTHVGIVRVYCKTHKDDCRGVTLDLSQENLRGLYVHEVPLSQIVLKSEHLEICGTGPLSVFSSLLCQFPPSLHSLYCKGIYEKDIPYLLERIPNLTRLNVLFLHHIKLGNQKLSLSPNMKHIEWVVLWEVTMESSVLKGLIKGVSELKQCVNIKIENCDVSTEEEFEEIKGEIRKSEEKFSIIFNGLNSCNRSEFRFQTVKHHL